MTRTPVARPAGAARIVATTLLAGLVVLVALLAPATPAAAHNQLVESDPAPKARLTTPPEAVTLVFLQSLDPEHTTVVVTDADESQVEAGEPVIDGGEVSVDLPPDLPDGEYTVAYRVLSNDGHPVQGSYTFTVATGRAPSPEPGESAAADLPATDPPATARPAADAVATDQPATAGDVERAAGERDGGSPTGPLVAVAAGAAAMLAVGAFLWRRRRRPAE